MVRTDPITENLANMKLSFGASPGPVVQPTEVKNDFAGREKNLPRGPAEIPAGPIYGQDAPRVSTLAAAVEKTPGAVLGQDDAGVSDTLSTRRFPRSRAQGAPALNVLPHT